MKRVSFKAAKAIKEAGYSQGVENTAWYNEKGFLVKPYVFNGGNEIADAPTYFEVGLWLWREKKINVIPEYDQISGLFSSCGVSERDDPEEAIIAAIEYLVDNDLIK